jgi:hypothetical protein
VAQFDSVCALFTAPISASAQQTPRMTSSTTAVTGKNSNFNLLAFIRMLQNLRLEDYRARNRAERDSSACMRLRGGMLMMLACSAASFSTVVREM